MSCDENQYVIVGQIGATFGIRGWVHVHSFTKPSSNILLYQPWMIGKNDGKWRELQDVQQKTHGNSAVACLDGVDLPETAQSLRGLYLAVDRDELPDTEPDEFYFDDLTDMLVYTTQNSLLGEVKQVIPTGASAVLDVKNENREYLIPFIRPVLQSVIERKIVVDWDEDWTK